MKRLFDILVSLLVLILFLPVGILISMAIICESRGGVFYRQIRVGKNGKLFRLWKFRTMRVNADKLGKLTVGMRDSRITKVGYFIRKSKLDEFPQFINVFLGQMSVVGPRPEVQEYVDLYTLEQREVLTVKPGITDYASLEYFTENELLGKSENPRETYIQEIMPAKIELNKKYIANPTLGQDIKIMWLTFLKMVK
ncbi:sugar transferase [Fluviicola taffensis]|uniref:Sugar transferase n=1 Tax=Fluviicola taffensis (strain DSM 16823 / NCIMB 13979 / RW262) TaxID=755732 RepID=F2IA22_FLUTR|nr:sugar transferase [Fluviicola taffensis]AEA44180.1 sugar transferase [Fluviicola taffensis DSM 16823]